MDEAEIQRLIATDRAHAWHPFTPMRQWRQREPIVVERGEGDELIDVRGRRYIDGVSSLWCNVHGHRVREIDDAIRAQLDRIAHSTMLGLSNVPATELAGKLVALAPGALTQVFYSDSGATATEVAFKMAVGYWHHTGRAHRDTFIALSGAYHGDTVGAMSIGYSEVFHRPYRKMVFHTEFVGPPRLRSADDRSSNGSRIWPLEIAAVCAAAKAAALAELDARLTRLGERCAGVVIEPMVQGAAGMVVQPAGYVRGVADLCRKHGTLLIADEVATGFGRTGRLFACEHEGVEPDVLCLGKGLSGGYLPVAATLTTRRIAEAFEGELHEMRTLYHGHTFTGNPLGCAAALASIGLFESRGVLGEVRRKAERLARGLDELRDATRFPHVADVRQCGLMVGIELDDAALADTRRPAMPSPALKGDSAGGAPLGDYGESADRHARRIGYEVTDAAREDGVIIRPLGNVVVLMPPLAITDANLDKLAAVTVRRIAALRG